MNDEFKKSLKLAGCTAVVYSIIGVQYTLLGLDGALRELANAIRREGLKNASIGVLQDLDISVSTPKGTN